MKTHHTYKHTTPTRLAASRTSCSYARPDTTILFHHRPHHRTAYAATSRCISALHFRQLCALADPERPGCKVHPKPVSRWQAFSTTACKGTNGQDKVKHYEQKHHGPSISLPHLHQAEMRRLFQRRHQRLPIPNLRQHVPPLLDHVANPTFGARPPTDACNGLLHQRKAPL